MEGSETGRDAAGGLSDKATRILWLIAEGCTYNQIVARNPGFTYNDIFNAAVEALKLAERPESVDRQAVTKAKKTVSTVERPAGSAAPSGYHERMAKIKTGAPRAYERWTQGEEEKLRALHRRGLPPREVAQALQRQPAAIRSRLAKLGLLEPGPAAG